MLEESQISIQSLKQIFQNAFMEVREVDDNKFSVQGLEHSFWIEVRIDPVRKLVGFCDYTQLQGLTIENACVLCNKANQQFNRSCFCVQPFKDAVMLTTEYDMSYEKGLIPYQLVANFRMHEKIVFAALQEFFAEYLAQSD